MKMRDFLPFFHFHFIFIYLCKALKRKFRFIFHQTSDMENINNWIMQKKKFFPEIWISNEMIAYLLLREREEEKIGNFLWYLCKGRAGEENEKIISLSKLHSMWYRISLGFYRENLNKIIISIFNFCETCEIWFF